MFGRACVTSTTEAGTLRTNVLGVWWNGERALVETTAGESVLLELWAPEAKFAFAHDAFVAWGRAVATGADRAMRDERWSSLTAHRSISAQGAAFRLRRDDLVTRMLKHARYSESFAHNSNQ